MKTFRTGALRLAADAARPSRMDAANDLVRRTLARHGLMPGGDGPEATSLLSGDLMRALGGRAAAAPGAVARLAIADGAEFRNDTFAARSGSRAYRTYVPASAEGQVTGVVMMLHGCTQTPEDFATGTGMNALAESGRFVVIYPEQSRGANAQTCWNWFSKGDQRRDRGEPEILAGMARKVAAEHSVGRERTFVAGLSAGAAMAVILGETYPDVFAAVGAHSGLPFGAASDVPSAFAAMAGTAAGSAEAPATGSDLRTIIFHGDADRTVHPANGKGIARWADARGAEITQQRDDILTEGGRRVQRRVTINADGITQMEEWTVAGLGHAWSGGKAGGSYTDPAGPDASAEMIRFFFDAIRKEV